MADLRSICIDGNCFENTEPVYTQAQTDALLDEKQDVLTAGENVQIDPNTNTISATDTTYSAGYGVDITDGVISVTIDEDLYIIVQSLPQSGEENKIYLVPKQGGGFVEWAYINNAWEEIGDTDIDLSNYYNKTETDALLDDKADADTVYTKTEVDTLLDDKADADTVYTKTEIDALLDDKADASSVYTKTETDALLDDKADADTVYTKTETDALLDDKADASSVYTKTETDALLEEYLKDEDVTKEYLLTKMGYTEIPVSMTVDGVTKDYVFLGKDVTDPGCVPETLGSAGAMSGTATYNVPLRIGSLTVDKIIEGSITVELTNLTIGDESLGDVAFDGVMSADGNWISDGIGDHYSFFFTNNEVGSVYFCNEYVSPEGTVSFDSITLKRNCSPEWTTFAIGGAWSGETNAQEQVVFDMDLLVSSLPDTILYRPIFINMTINGNTYPWWSQEEYETEPSFCDVNLGTPSQAYLLMPYPSPTLKIFNYNFETTVDTISWDSVVFVYKEVE